MPYTVTQLSDLESIRQVVQRYSHGVDRLNEAVMKSAYWPDATDEHGGYRGNAHTFVEFCMKSHQGYRSTNHCNLNHLIELDQDGIHATGELYNVAYLFHGDSEVLDTWHGRYLDEYEKRGEEWRISKRVCVHEGTRSEAITPMAIDAAQFTQGDHDRHVS